MTASGGSGSGALSLTASGSTCSILVSGPDTGKLAITSGTGDCFVTAHKAADANYNAADSAAHPVTISKAEQATLTVTSPDAGTFGDHLTMTASGGRDRKERRLR